MLTSLVSTGEMNSPLMSVITVMSPPELPLIVTSTSLIMIDGIAPSSLTVPETVGSGTISLIPILAVPLSSSPSS